MEVIVKQQKLWPPTELLVINRQWLSLNRHLFFFAYAASSLLGKRILDP